MGSVQYCYSNLQAVQDGIFTDVTPNSMADKGQMWLLSTDVAAMNLSRAAIGELYNELAVAYNQGREINPLITLMNGKCLWLFLESEDNYTIFKVITPNEY